MKKGDKIICIENPTSVDNQTRKGVVYVVENVWENPYSKGIVSLDLEDTFNGGEGIDSDFWGHKASRFRKLDTDHTESFKSSELSRRLANQPQVEELKTIKIEEYVSD